MIFDLSTLHLGDVLMALPAMRRSDSVITPAQHRIPGAPVHWLDAGSAKADVKPAMVNVGHTTDAWLRAAGRDPVRHRLMPEPQGRHGVVIAPIVSAPEKQWHRWDELQAAIPEATVISESATREQWMAALNEADVVVCPDTGTAHMADALGCPKVVVLHGVSANWPRCAPYWDRRFCIFRDSMGAITVDDVVEVICG